MIPPVPIIPVANIARLPAAHRPAGNADSEGRRKRANRRTWKVLPWLGLVVLLRVAPELCAATPDASAFDAGNKLYEQGKYREAASAYETLVKAGTRSETLCFNLGNAWFKAGQIGRAIAAWRQAEEVSPRDPSVRFNLQFARKQVTGAEAPATAMWPRILRALTLNEWSVLASIALWLWFLLLALREFRPALKPTLSGYTATAGAVVLVLGVGLGAAANLQLGTTTAVVIAPETLARSGPLDEAKVLHQFRDGTELTVIDRKEIAGDARQAWLQVRDAANRTGWVRADGVIVLGAAPQEAAGAERAPGKVREAGPPAHSRVPPSPFVPPPFPVESAK